MLSRKGKESAKTNVCPGLPGDLIVFERTLYKHYAVNVGDGEIVHLTAPEGGGIAAHMNSCSANSQKAVVKKEKYEDVFKEGDKAYKEQLTNDHLPRQEIVKRAKSRIGQQGYHLLSYNCEHFARWCCYGVWESTQATAVIGVILLVLLIFLPILFRQLIKN